MYISYLHCLPKTSIRLSTVCDGAIDIQYLYSDNNFCLVPCSCHADRMKGVKEYYPKL